MEAARETARDQLRSHRLVFARISFWNLLLLLLVVVIVVISLLRLLVSTDSHCPPDVSSARDRTTPPGASFLLIFFGPAILLPRARSFFTFIPLKSDFHVFRMS